MTAMSRWRKYNFQDYLIPQQANSNRYNWFHQYPYNVYWSIEYAPHGPPISHGRLFRHQTFENNHLNPAPSHTSAPFRVKWSREFQSQDHLSPARTIAFVAPAWWGADRVADRLGRSGGVIAKTRLSWSRLDNVLTLPVERTCAPLVVLHSFAIVLLNGVRKFHQCYIYTWNGRSTVNRLLALKYRKWISGPWVLIYFRLAQTNSRGFPQCLRKILNASICYNLCAPFYIQVSIVVTPWHNVMFGYPGSLFIKK